MFSAVLFVGLLQGLCQQGFDVTRSAETSEVLLRAQQAAAQAGRKELSAQGKKEFADRFNKLVEAVKEFEDEYSRSQGHVWPVKQAAKLERAMKELSAAQGWRKGPN